MFRKRQFIATCFAIAALSSAPTVITAGTSAELDLQPFTHITHIPVDADLPSIQFQRIKVTRVATKLRATTDPQYCDGRVASEPGGSLYCPHITSESPVPAYQVTFSFIGPSMASDEHGNTHFTFSVYFRPDEISAGLYQALSSGKMRSTEASEYFPLTMSREPVQQMGVDEQHSTFCAGTYVDGNWTHTNPKCHDTVAYQRVANLSPYVTVRVDPAARLRASAAPGGRGDSKSLARISHQ